MNKIYIEPTTRCNLRCVTCIRHVWNEPEGDMQWTTYENIIKSLQDFPGPKTIAWAGIGEPLLHPRLPDMIRLAHEKGMRTEITTNGLLLSRDLSLALLEAGLDQLAVSLDGASNKQYEDIRTGGSLSSVVANVHDLYALSVKKARPLRIGIVFVAMKRNIHELPKVGELAKMTGSSFILVTNVIPYSADLQDEILYHVKPNVYENSGTPQIPLWILPNMDFNALTEASLTRILRAYSNISFLDMYLGERSNYCPFVQSGAIAISWQGDVSPCPALLHSHSCYIRKRPKTFYRCQFGCINEEPLSAIWSGKEFASFRKRVRAFDFPPCIDCGGCSLAETNETDCLNNPFPVCGDCLWARGLIRCP